MQRVQNTEIKFGGTNLALVGLVAVFAVSALAVALLVFSTVRGMVSTWDVTDLPGLAISEGGAPQPGETAAPGDPVPVVNPPASGPQAQPWDGASRVNLLVMGLDYRDWEAGEGAPRTDTMILLSVDPLTKTAGMLSIPRDLWVNIPGFEPNRINTAYRFGEVYELPGGGPGLAMQTVEQLLGLKIDYYALVDFYAFERFIDEIGGVKIDVPHEIKVDPLGDNNTKKLKPGVQTLPGYLALAYARARNTEGGDFDRAQRQQQVIMGIRNRILSAEMLPTLILRSQAIYQDLSAGVRTNLTLEQAIQLAWLAQQIPEENIKKGVIGTEHVTLAQTTDKQDVLKPRPEKIRLLRDEIFTAAGAVSPATDGADLEQLVRGEAARVVIFNGANAAGLATRTMDYLQAGGLTVVETGDAPEQYMYTTVIDYTGNPYTLKYLVETMGISPEKIFHRYDPASQIDVAVMIGYDWANSNPMP